MASNFIPRIGLQQRQLPSVPTVNQPAFTGFQSLGAVAETFQKIQDGARKAELAFQIVQGDEKLKGAYELLREQKVDPEEFKQSGAETLQETLDSHLEGITDLATRREVEGALQIPILKIRNNMEIDYHKKLKAKAEGQFIAARGGAVRDAAAGDAQQRAIEEKKFQIILDEQIKDGFIQPAQREKELIKFKEDVDKTRAGEMLFKNPRLLKAVVETEEGKKQFPTFSGTELYAWGQKAGELIRERDQEGIKAEKARVEKVNVEMLKKITAPGASLVMLREEVRREAGLSLDAKDAEHWITKIDAAIKAREKALKEPKEIDPYKTSDTRVLAQVMAGVLNDPDKWTVQRITDMIGPPGLGTSDALRATSLLAQSQKDTSGAMTPMKQMQRSWDSLQRNGAFVTADERKTGGSESVMKNDREAQRVLDQVHNRAFPTNGSPGEDPRVVLDELMVPHRENKITSWFTPWKWPGFSPEEEDKARQSLIRAGIIPTPEKIKDTVEFHRKRKTPARSGQPEY